MNARNALTLIKVILGVISIFCITFFVDVIGLIENGWTTFTSYTISQKDFKLASNRDPKDLNLTANGGQMDLKLTEKGGQDDPSRVEKSKPLPGGMCSRAASEVGYHQKVIVYSLYGNKKIYWTGLAETIGTIKNLYPGWLVRIYTDRPDEVYVKHLRDLFKIVYICDARNLPPPMNSAKDIPGMIWRFIPLKDPHVDVVMVRDADSQILQREVDAVSEWLDRTHYSLHVMRDHPYHGVPILGGMWGARIDSNNRDKWKKICNKMLKRAFKSKVKHNLDQPMLASLVYPAFVGDRIAHDSYTCARFSGSLPFPTRRCNGTFVGAQYYVYHANEIKKECPVRCRPKSHRDWTLC